MCAEARLPGAGADLKTYTRKLEVSREKLPGWPSDRLTVLVEQAAVFYDIMTPDIMERVRIKDPRPQPCLRVCITFALVCGRLSWPGPWHS